LAPNTSLEKRARAGPGEPQARRVDQAHRVAHLAAKAPRGGGQHVREQLGEDARIAVAIGVGEGRALRRAGARVIKPRPMARHHRLDFAQRGRAAELGEQQRQELMPRREAPHRLVGAEFGDQFVKRRPRNQFEQVVEDAIGVAHGVDPCFVSK
jgi:hypothetical protein